MYQLRKVITNTKTLKQIYYGLIFSHIQYCISSWASAAPTNLTALDSLHNRSLRIILKQNRRSHLNPLYFELKLLKINDMYILQIGKIMYKIVNKTWAGDYKLLPIESIHTHYTRHSSSSNFYVQNTNLNSTKNAITIAGPIIWENVPKELKRLPFRLFVNQYKMFLINNYDESM